MTLAAENGLVDFAKLMIYTAMLIYALAFLAYIAEWVFGSRSKVGRTAAALTDGEKQKAAGEAEHDTEGASTADDDQTAGGDRSTAESEGASVPAQRPAVTVRKGGGASVLDRPKIVTRSSTPHRDQVPDGPGAAGGDDRGDLMGRVAVALVVVAFLLHAGGVVTRALAVERAPWANMYEFSTAFSMMVVAGFFGLLIARKNVRWLGLPMVTTVLLDLGLAVTVLYSDSDTLPPALQSVWLWIHVALAIVCGAMFYLGMVATVAFLLRDRFETRVAAGKAGTGLGASIMDRLPSSVTLDKFAYRINAAVFPLWTFTIIAGAIWAEAAWGRYWGWDPKEVWSFITWVLYAAYLHARATVGWRGRKAAYLAIAAFLCFLFNYYGVNMFVNSLHSYAGV